MTFSYEAIANSVYLVALLGVLIYCGLRIVTKPDILLVYTRIKGIVIWVPVVVLTILMTLFLVIGKAIGEIANPGLAEVILANGAVTLLVGACVLPVALDVDKPTAGKTARRFAWFELFGLAVVGIAWSLLAINVAESFVQFEIKQDGFLPSISTTRVFEYLGFSCFALSAAFLEEIIFRGGLQGILERYRVERGWAVVIAAFLFALGHTGYISPDGIKELQIFGLALIFGFAKMRHGLTGAIAVHLANNFFAVMTQFLLGDSPGF